MYLLDTDVFSLTSPTSGLRGAEIEKWRDWVKGNDAHLHLSVITIMEVRFGIEKSRIKGSPSKSNTFEAVADCCRDSLSGPHHAGHHRNRSLGGRNSSPRDCGRGDAKFRRCPDSGNRRSVRITSSVAQSQRHGSPQGEFDRSARYPSRRVPASGAIRRTGEELRSFQSGAGLQQFQRPHPPPHSRHSHKRYYGIFCFLRWNIDLFQVHSVAARQCRALPSPKFGRSVHLGDMLA